MKTPLVRVRSAISLSINASILITCDGSMPLVYMFAMKIHVVGPLHVLCLQDHKWDKPYNNFVAATTMKGVLAVGVDTLCTCTYVYVPTCRMSLIPPVVIVNSQGLSSSSQYFVLIFCTVWSVNTSTKTATSLLYEFCQQYLRATPIFTVEETSM